MEKKKTNQFNRLDYFKSNISGLLQSESKGLNLVIGRLNALNKQPLLNTSENLEKRKILEKCLALFRSQKFKEHVRREKKERGILEQTEVTRENRLENLRRIASYSEELTDRLSEIVLGDLKRTYNMSDICTAGMLKTGLPVKLHPVSNGLASCAQDDLANTITIEHIGELTYETLSSNESISQYKVTKKMPHNEIHTYEVFSYIDLNEFDVNPEYRQIILGTLLSNNNLEFSNANGYIGKIQNTSDSQTQLNVGEEIYGDDYYRYQVSPKYSLEYNGERIEAIKTYIEQQEKSSTQSHKEEER